MLPSPLNIYCLAEKPPYSQHFAPVTSIAFFNSKVHPEEIKILGPQKFSEKCASGIESYSKIRGPLVFPTVEASQQGVQLLEGTTMKLNQLH